jgi:hypothetical protein
MIRALASTFKIHINKEAGGGRERERKRELAGDPCITA